MYQNSYPVVMGDPIMMARELCRQKAVYHVHGKDSRITPHIRGLDCYEQGICNGPAVTPTWNCVAVGCGHDALWWKTFFATLAEAIITARFPSRSRIR